MKNKIFQITPVQLNTGSVIELDISLAITAEAESGSGNNRVDTYYPLQIRIENNSGVTINFNIIDDENEYDEWKAGATYYEMLPLLDTGRVMNDVTQKIYRFVCQKTAGTATGSVILYCVNYVVRGR